MPVRAPQRHRPAPLLDRLDAFLALVAHLGAASADAPDWRLRDRLVVEFERDFPAPTPDEAERARIAINRACGVGW